MSGESLAILSAMLYGMAGVTIGQGKKQAKGDNGVFLSVLITLVLTFCLWMIWGKIHFADVMRWSALPGLLSFALAGFCSTVLGRVGMYRATEQIGAVKASLYRRLIPVFTLPIGFALLAQWPEAKVLLGGALILIGVIGYQFLSSSSSKRGDRFGALIAIASAICYAFAYSLRSMGLADLPDALLGTLIGAIVGLLWFPIVALLSAKSANPFQHLICDRSFWHWMTGLSLGFGQTLQFMALNTAAVSTVSILGSLDLFFSAVCIATFVKTEKFNVPLLLAAGAIAFTGSAIIFSA